MKHGEPEILHWCLKLHVAALSLSLCDNARTRAHTHLAHLGTSDVLETQPWERGGGKKEEEKKITLFVQQNNENMRQGLMKGNLQKA